MVELIAPGPTGMAEAHVQRHQAAADMRHGAVERDAPLFVAIEAQMQRRADETPALRCADRDRSLAVLVDRIGVAGRILLLVFEEGPDITPCREAETQHERILGAIDQFIQPAGLETGGQANLCAADNSGLALETTAECPFGVRDSHARRV